jgi:hypothetical protein
MACDCGWRGEIAELGGQHEDEDVSFRINQLFLEHIPAAEHEAYLLVDQRQSDQPKPGTEVINQDGEIEDAEMLPRGNWIMPTGIPCTILRWYENGDEYRAVVRKFETGASEIDILVGEVRTADGRVFGCA